MTTTHKPSPDVEIPEGFKYTPAQQVVWDWWCEHEKAPPICDDLNDLIWKLDAIKTSPLPDEVEKSLDRPFHNGYHLLLPKHIKTLSAHIAALEVDRRTLAEYRKSLDLCEAEVRRLTADNDRLRAALAHLAGVIKAGGIVSSSNDKIGFAFKLHEAMNDAYAAIAQPAFYYQTPAKKGEPK